MAPTGTHQKGRAKMSKIRSTILLFLTFSLLFSFNTVIAAEGCPEKLIDILKEEGLSINQIVRICEKLKMSAKNSDDIFNSLEELGYYAVTGDKVTRVSFSYEEKSIPSAFQNRVTSNKDLHFVVYGSPGSVQDVRLIDPSRNFKRIKNWNFNSFFSAVPLGNHRGEKVIKLKPKFTEKGTYMIHRFVGINGDDYLIFSIE